VAELLNRHTGLFETAEIVSPIVQQDVDCYVNDWRPPIDAKIEELKQAGLYTLQGVGDHNLEDHHWLWPQKVQDRASQLQWNSYALRCGGRSQGLMFVNVLRRCRVPSQLNEHLVYIDLVSTAPWNRNRLVPRPLYGGVGLGLVVEAILLSHAEGFGGRIGLHALPGAVDFYSTQWPMEAFGPDPSYHSLHYFEMTSARAAEFLGS
jgi:hypothetical protein